MAEKLNVSVVTPDGAVTRKEVDSVTAPSKLGEVTVLPDHIPIIAELEAGVVTMRAGDGVDIYAVTSGFLEVERHNVLILADNAQSPDDVDVPQCEKAIKEANEKLASLDGHDPAYAENVARIKRNEARLRIAAN